jgi:hypothetical protein
MIIFLTNYEQGKYSETLTTLVQAHGNRNFQHEFLYTSLTLQTLKDGNDKPLALNVAGYDLIEQHKAQETMTHVLERLTK